MYYIAGDWTTSCYISTAWEYSTWCHYIGTTQQFTAGRHSLCGQYVLSGCITLPSTHRQLIVQYLLLMPTKQWHLFNGHLPVQPGKPVPECLHSGYYWNKGWWMWGWQLELYDMQSSGHNIITSKLTPMFYRPNAFCFQNIWKCLSDIYICLTVLTIILLHVWCCTVFSMLYQILF